jgi:sugar lactone lactonase YvrE
MRILSAICLIIALSVMGCGTHPANGNHAGDPGSGSPAGKAPSPEVIDPAIAHRLSFMVEPTSAAPFQSISPAIQVALQDSAGHTLSANSGTPITLTLGGQPGTLCGTLTQSTLNGVATFPDINVYEAGEGFTLTASAEGSTSVTSHAFSIWSELDALAGSTGGPGNIDGPWSTAKLNRPSSVAVDSHGNVIVTDGANNNVRLIGTDGWVTTIAGNPLNLPGSTDGIGSEASFSNPSGVAVDAQGNIFVADTGNNTIRKIAPDQWGNTTVTTLAGTAGVTGSADGKGAAASFHAPGSLALDSVGNLYVFDTLNGTIRKVTAAGVVTTLAGTPGNFGSDDGVGRAASFGFPLTCGVPLGTPALAVDAQGNVFVADSGNGKIRKITPAGTVTTIFDSTSPGGSNVLIFVDRPSGVAVDSSGDVFFVDSIGDEVFELDAQGNLTVLAGNANASGNTDGVGSSATFNGPSGLAIDGAGNLYVADSGNSSVRRVTSQGSVQTLVGSTAIAGDADGVGAQASFEAPTGIVVDAAGNTWIADSGNRTVRRITPQGETTTLQTAAGTGPVFLGGQAAGLTVDAAGNLYVADMEPYSILKVSPDGIATTLVANSAVHGEESAFYSPAGIAVDRSGNVYFTDLFSNSVRKVTPEGAISVFAGSFQPGSADGTGTAAAFNAPQGVALDDAGNLYVADSGNNTLRRITPGGVVTTMAGSAGLAGSADGVGAAARFQSPQGLAVDRAGNVFVADTGNGTIRKITQAGEVTTVVGAPGVSGIETGSLPAGLRAPTGVALRPSGELVIVDGVSVLVTGGAGSRWWYWR